MDFIVDAMTTTEVYAFSTNPEYENKCKCFIEIYDFIADKPVILNEISKCTELVEGQIKLAQNIIGKITYLYPNIFTYIVWNEFVLLRIHNKNHCSDNIGIIRVKSNEDLEDPLNTPKEKPSDICYNLKKYLVPIIVISGLFIMGTAFIAVKLYYGTLL